MKKALILLALALTLTGCTSIGICERRAIAEEQRGFMAGQPIFRVHYRWFDMDGIESVEDIAAANPKLKHHAINYLLHVDQSRSYYDVGKGDYVVAPLLSSIWYDSYDVRVDGDKTFPPQAAPRHGG